MVRHLKLSLVAFVVVFVLSLASVGEAAVIDSYTFTSTAIALPGDGTANEYNGFIFTLATGATIESITLRTRTSAGCNTGAGNHTFALFDANGDVLTSVVKTDAVAADTEYTLNFADVDVEAGLYFFGIHYNSGAGCEMMVQQHNAGYAGGDADACLIENYLLGTNLTYTSTCTAVYDDFDAYFKINGVAEVLDEVELGYAALITDIYLPSPRSAVATTTTPTFSWRIFNATLGPGATTCVVVQQVVPVFELAHTAYCEDINATGYQSVSSTTAVVFDDNAQYQWHIIINNEDSVRVWTSAKYSWQTGALADASYIPMPDSTGTEGTTTAITNMGNATLDYLQGVAPFSYYFQVSGALEAGLLAASSSADDLTLVLDTGFGTTTVWDDDTWTMFLDESDWAGVRVWVGHFIWFMFAMSVSLTMLGRFQNTK